MHESDLELARQYAPVLHFDAAEPFLPTRVGYTVFRTTGTSPSFPRYVRIELPAVMAIEYAIWWDWDIQHLYELEHVWVYVDETGQVVGAEASQHGDALGGDVVLVNGRPRFYAEPGKHALTQQVDELLERRSGTTLSCGDRAGVGGVWITPLFHDRLVKTPDADQLARTFLKRHAFTPSFAWSRVVEVSALPLEPWPELERAIPGMIDACLARCDAMIPRAERHVVKIGHRGAGVYAPHNTLHAIRTAAGMGADVVELDVRMSADGVPVLAHDPHVFVKGRGEVRIDSLPLGELQYVSPSPEVAIPSLQEALDLCAKQRVAPFLEIKERQAVNATMAALIAHGIGRFCIVGSFDPAIVARATDLAPHIPTSILLGDWDVDPVALARSCGASYITPCWERHAEPHILLAPAWLERVRNAGLGVTSWHEERPAVLRALLGLGLSGICTDRLDLLAEVMRVHYATAASP